MYHLLLLDLHLYGVIAMLCIASCGTEFCPDHLCSLSWSAFWASKTSKRCHRNWSLIYWKHNNYN